MLSICFIFLLSLISITIAQPLAVLNVTDTSDPYQFGKMIGQTFSKQIQTALDNDPQFQSVNSVIFVEDDEKKKLEIEKCLFSKCLK